MEETLETIKEPEKDVTQHYHCFPLQLGKKNKSVQYKHWNVGVELSYSVVKPNRMNSIRYMISKLTQSNSVLMCKLQFE
jgi:hypothetical protein